MTMLRGTPLRVSAQCSSRLPLLLVVLLAATTCRCAVPADEVLNLPGLSQQPSFKHYSGYLNATGTVHFHYWFVESMRDPATDPVVLWLNGGPGCSSMEGMLNENGPFHIDDDGRTIYINPYAWNRVANVLYLESPAGVGFSYSDDGSTDTDDDKTSLNNYVALKQFFKLYPEYLSNDFYLFGESYAGIYIPTLAVRVAADSFFANFRGIGVGNGFSSDKLNTNSIVYFAYYHGLISQSAWTTLITSCCNGNETKCDFIAGSQGSGTCGKALNAALDVVYNSGLNEYNLYQDCDTASVQKSDRVLVKRRMSDVAIVRPFQLRSTFEMLRAEVHAAGKKLQVVPNCANVTTMDMYLNDPAVRKALHIPDSLPEWEICADINYTTLYSSMSQQYLSLLAQGKHILVYNGDVDMACNFLGDEWFTDALQQPLVADFQPWLIKAGGTLQVAGFIKQYRNLRFVTVKGSGHMVPQDKPAPAFEMFATFLQDAASPLR